MPGTLSPKWGIRQEQGGTSSQNRRKKRLLRIRFMIELVRF